MCYYPMPKCKPDTDGANIAMVISQRRLTSFSNLRLTESKSSELDEFHNKRVASGLPAGVWDSYRTAWLCNSLRGLG